MTGGQPVEKGENSRERGMFLSPAGVSELTLQNMSDNGQRDVAELEELTRRIKALARNTPDDTVLQTSLMAAATMLTKGAARALGRDLSPVGRRPSTAFKGSLSALRSMRTIRFIGAPFCEGQNLDGADLGPTALREAGLQPLAEMLGWSWEDAGDLDFAAEFERLGFEVSAPHHHPVELYREWVGDSGMRDTPRRGCSRAVKAASSQIEA